MTASETPYVETEALIACLDEDYPRAASLLSGWSLRELDEFGAAVDELSAVIPEASDLLTDEHGDPLVGVTR